MRINFCRVLLVLLFTSPLAAFSQDRTSVDTLHYGPSAWILGDLYLNQVFGNVDAATVTDAAGNFSPDTLEEILADLAVSSSTSTIPSSTNVLWATRYETVASTNQIDIFTPNGTRLDDTEAHDFQIGAFSFNERGTDLDFTLTEFEANERIRFTLPTSQGNWPVGTEVHLMGYLEDKEILTPLAIQSGPRVPWMTPDEVLRRW